MREEIKSGGLNPKPRIWSLACGAYGACGMKPVAESLGSEACSLELWVMEQGAWNRWASKPGACGLKAEVELEACNVEYISECVSRVVV